MILERAGVRADLPSIRLDDLPHFAPA